MIKNDPRFWTSVTLRLCESFEVALKQPPMSLPACCRQADAKHEGHELVCGVLREIEELNRPLATMLQQLIVRAHFCGSEELDARVLSRQCGWPHWQLEICSGSNDGVVAIEACDFDSLQRQRDCLLHESESDEERALVRWSYAAYHSVFVYLHRRKLAVSKFRFSLLASAVETLVRVPGLAPFDVTPITAMLLHETSL